MPLWSCSRVVVRRTGISLAFCSFNGEVAHVLSQLAHADGGCISLDVMDSVPPASPVAGNEVGVGAGLYLHCISIRLQNADLEDFPSGHDFKHSSCTAGQQLSPGSHRFSAPKCRGPAAEEGIEAGLHPPAVSARCGEQPSRPGDWQPLSDLQFPSTGSC